MNAVSLPDPLVCLAAAAPIRGPPHRRIDPQAERPAPADERIRKRYGIHPGTVQSANSLRGAALVGGMMLAFRIRQRFPCARITEAHPKALLLALGLDGPDFAERFGISTGWRNEHERDGAIAAVCAREGFEGRWPADLTEQRHCSELDPQSYCLAPMRYFWPEPV